MNDSNHQQNFPASSNPGQSVDNGLLRFDAPEGWIAPEGFWKSILDNIAGFVLVVDETQHIVYSNRAEASYAMDDIIGRTITSFIQPRFHDLYFAAITRLNDTGVPQSFEIDDPLPDGSTNWWIDRVSLMQFAGQNYYLIIAHNISQNMRVELAQHEQDVANTVLYQSVASMTPLTGPRQVMDDIIVSIGRVVTFDRVDIMFIDGDCARVSASLGYSLAQDSDLRTECISPHNTVFEQMLHSRTPTIYDAGGENVYRELKISSASYLGVPILDNETVIGFINLHSDSREAFHEAQAEHLQGFAEQAALAFKNAAIYARISRRADDIMKLQRATALLFTSLSTAQTLEGMGLQIAQAAVNAFDLVDSGIILLDQESGELRRLARVGSYEVGARHQLFLDGPGLVPSAARTGQMIYAPEVEQDPRYITGDPRTQSELAIPLLSGSNVIGVIDIQSSEANAFNESDQRVLMAFAERAAIAIENMQLDAAIRRYANDLEERVIERTREVYTLNEQMSIILHNTSDAILLLEGNGHIKASNTAFDRQFGYSANALAGQPLLVITDPDDQAALETLYQEVQDTRQIRRAEIRVKRKNGATFIAEINLAHVQNDTNQVVCTVHDISRLKDIEHMKDSFISTVSHELRTPIAAIVLLANSLNTHRHRMTDTQIERKLGQLHTQSLILGEMVEAILDLSRLEDHTHEPGTNIVNMAEVVETVVSELRPSADLKIQSLTLEAPGGPLYLKGDFMEFARIWRNLINNAIKYTPDAGQITVRLACLNGGDAPNFVPESIYGYQPCIVGQIEDNGHGIEDMDNLFKRFHRGWAKYSTIPGSGLGLPLVHELLTIYGGDIIVSSVPAEGSIFTFWIPFEEDSANDERLAR